MTNIDPFASSAPSAIPAEPAIGSGFGRMGGVDDSSRKARKSVEDNTRSSIALRVAMALLTKGINALVSSLKNGQNPSVGGGSNSYIKTISTTLSGGGDPPEGTTAAMRSSGGMPISPGKFGAATFLSSAFSAAGAAVGARVDRGYNYSLAADKMSVLYQQMTGMSQQGVQDAFRYPLTNYRLGGGESINTLLQMQAQTGLVAAKQAAGFEALRTATGYGFTAGDMTSMATAMASPEVVNRMFMTTGMSMIGVGGKQNSMMDVIQRLVQKTGLTDEKVLKGAFLPGSVSRQQLRFMGLPEDMQNMVLQYAQENVAFKQKGGTGMYDPSKKEDRARMGIEEAFATQREETDRVKMLREENFYNRQADNFADMEKITQKLTETFGKLEEKLSGILGTGISGGGLTRTAGGIMQAIGTGLMFTGNPFGIGAGLALMAGGAAFGSGGIGGDPVPSEKGNSDLVIPAYRGKTTLSKVKSSAGFRGMHPKMQERVASMIIASGGRVGFGEGLRSSATQEKMFRDRYRKAQPGEKADATWNGESYVHVKGAAAAPPGKSMHEIGLAADLTGDMEWIKQNAHRFNLRSFHDVNNEPWHVQPNELPGSRSEYHKQGSAWGGGPAGTAPSSDSTYELGGRGEQEEAGGGSSSSSGGILSTFSGMSQGEILAAAIDMNRASFLGGTGSGTTAKANRGAGNLTYSSSESVTVPTGGGKISPNGMVALLRRHGYSGSDLQKALGISWRESRWDPRAFNPKNRDLSYGLFQINMKGDLGPARRKRSNLSNNEQLFDPETNVRVARQMLDESNGEWRPWRTNMKVPGTEMNGWKSPITNMAAAASVIRDVDRSGDPMPNVSSRGGSTTVVHGGNNITIAPVININGGSDAYRDMAYVARECGRLLKAETDIVMMRSS